MNSINYNWRRRRVLIICPFEYDLPVIFDVPPDFDIITFSYNGQQLSRALYDQIKPVRHIIISTEFWGESFFKLIKIIQNSYEAYGFLNSDVYMTVSDINKTFDLGDLKKLDFWQPSLSRSSFYSHSFLLHDSSKDIEEVPFIEIMMPFLSNKVLQGVVAINKYTISGWGMDNYLFNKVKEVYSLKSPHVIHRAQGFHFKPIESNTRIFSNGLSALQEMELLFSQFSSEQVVK